MDAIARAVDFALEASFVGSNSRAGCAVRRRLEHWEPLDEIPSVAGRTVLVTGATSGIGEAAATMLARLGASVRCVNRHEGRGRQALERITGAVGAGADVRFYTADVSDYASVRSFAERFETEHDSLDVLVHNAGMLSRPYLTAPDGSELTLATHVIGPYLLTGQLLPLLRHAAPSRVITVSSSGMYAQRYDMQSIEMDADRYDGRIAYARAKRAQLVLNEEWARRVPREQVVFHAMHPGWVETPGIRRSLPGFHRLTAPLLRTPEQGAETAVWLAVAREPLGSPPRLWHDRRPRSLHRFPWTGDASTGAELWELCARRTGWRIP